MSPVKPADFQALQVSGSETLCSAQIKVFLKGPVVWLSQLKYLMKPDGSIGDQFGNDICAIECPATPTTTP